MSNVDIACFRRELEFWSIRKHAMSFPASRLTNSSDGGKPADEGTLFFTPFINLILQQAAFKGGVIKQGSAVTSQADLFA